MNKLIYILPVAIITAGSALLLLSGCSDQSVSPPVATTNNVTVARTNNVPAPGTNVLYTCPMHPQIVTNKPGNCPLCGMDLVPKE